MFFCGEFCFPAFQNFQMWLIKESDPGWRWKQPRLLLWVLCPELYFYVLTAGLMFLGSGSILPMGAGCSPVNLLWSHPHNSKPVSPSADLAFRFPGSVYWEKGQRGARALINGTEWCRARRKRWIKGGVKELVENGEMDERRTKRREERWMSWDGWVTWLLSE